MIVAISGQKITIIQPGICVHSFALHPEWDEDGSAAAAAADDDDDDGSSGDDDLGWLQLANVLPGR